MLTLGGRDYGSVYSADPIQEARRCRFKKIRSFPSAKPLCITVTGRFYQARKMADGGSDICVVSGTSPISEVFL